MNKPGTIARHCQTCGIQFYPSASSLNRAEKIGAKMFCGLPCSHVARRKNVSRHEKAKAKAAYDARRRVEKKDILKKKKSEYYQRTRNPEKEKEKRKKQMPRHVEYCRKPVYREKKKVYDSIKRASEYGQFSEAYEVLLMLEKEMRKQQSGYERRKAKGYYQRSSIERRRELCRAMRTTQRN